MSTPPLPPPDEQDDAHKTHVHLYIYDLSNGLASQLSLQLTGIYIPAIYHTSLVLSPSPQATREPPTEYFYGRDIQSCAPGFSPHGRPVQVLHLGDTQIPADVIAEYLADAATAYHPTSYDLWVRNCNNFTDDFAEFLVGKGIPEEIRELPERVLGTPFGAMLRGRIDGAMMGVTQAPVARQDGGRGGRRTG